jgi:anti-sigma regulatory factor (Ser/Thr protein kinase)
VAGAAGVTYRLRVPPWAIPAARRDLRVLRRAALAHPDTFRASLGIGTDGALYLLVVARSAEPVRRLRSDPEHIRIVRRWRRRLWWSTWEPEGEFGQWESRKLRDGRLSGAPPLVDEALPVRPEIAKQAREILRERLGALDDGSLVLVELLTSELVGNSYRHAGLSAADDIRLRAAAGDGWVRVEVIDRGKRFEPHVPVEKPSTDQSGWGLYMVNRTADRWGVVDRPNDRLFWFELRLRTAH